MIELLVIVSVFECVVFDFDEFYLLDVGGVFLVVVFFVVWVLVGVMFLLDVMDEMFGQVCVVDFLFGDWIVLWVEGDFMDQILLLKSIIFVDCKWCVLVFNVCYVIEDGDGNVIYKCYCLNLDCFELVLLNKEFLVIFLDNMLCVVGCVMWIFFDFF